MRPALRRTAIAAVIILAAGVLAWPFLVAWVFGPSLQGEWGGETNVGAAHWFFGDTVVLERVVAPQSGTPSPMIEVDRIELRFERVPVLNDPGKLVAADFLGGTLRWQGRPVCTVARVSYRYDAEQGKRLTIDGLDGVFVVERASDWIDVITRITDAPGVAGDGQGAFMRAIEVVASKLAIDLSVGDGEPQRLSLEGFGCRLHPTAKKALAIDELTAALMGGDLRVHGTVDWTDEPVQWRAQANLQHLDLARAGAELDMLPESSVGEVTAFADLGVTATGELGGAGWIEGKNIVVADQPVTKRVVEEVGVAPASDDVLDEVRGDLMLDRGRLYFRQLIVLSRTINLFGNGSMALPGGEILAGFVPRFRSQRLEDVPLASDRASDVVLDVLKGALVEVRVEGRIDAPEVFVQPVPVVTEPLRRFLDLFR